MGVIEIRIGGLGCGNGGERETLSSEREAQERGEGGSVRKRKH